MWENAVAGPALAGMVGVESFSELVPRLMVVMGILIIKVGIPDGSEMNRPTT
jgi:hypothetical protein